MPRLGRAAIMGTPKMRFKRRRPVWCGAQGDASAGFYRVFLSHPVKCTGFAFRGALIRFDSNQKKPVATTQSFLGNSPAPKKQLEVVMQICR
jgi:hypothetical protein